MHLQRLLHCGLHIILLGGLQTSEGHRERECRPSPHWELVTQFWSGARADELSGLPHLQTGLMALPEPCTSTPKKQPSETSPECSPLPPSPIPAGSQGPHKTSPDSVCHSTSPNQLLIKGQGSSKTGPQYLAEEDVNREGTTRDVEDGDIPKKGSKFLCIHGGRCDDELQV